jgi:hypothetical protein
VHRASLRLTRACHQPSLFQHLNVLRDRLFGDLERLRQLVDGGRAPAEPGDDPPANRIGQSSERPVESIVGRRIHDHLSTISFINQLIDLNLSMLDLSVKWSW